VEIAKLRLFLKLVAQVERVEAIEPLPDIDFNIRAGNTLVGFATRDQMIDAVRGDKLLLLPEEEDALARIEEQAADVERLFDKFRAMQTAYDGRDFGDDYASTKQALQQRLGALGGELDGLLAHQYGVNPAKLEYEPWRKTHQPFHWFVEFYGIIKQGGFDVIIGNPPYVVYGEVKRSYTIINYHTAACNNLYAFTTERSLAILQSTGRLGLIIPVASVCTDGFSALQGLLRKSGTLFVSSYNDRPGKLFDGLEHIRLSIVILQKHYYVPRQILTTNYNKWQTIERLYLFQKLRYVESHDFAVDGSILKLATEIEKSILRKVLLHSHSLDSYARRIGQYKIYYTRKLSYFVQILDFAPTILDEHGKKRDPSELKIVSFDSEITRDAYLGLLKSILLVANNIL